MGEKWVMPVTFAAVFAAGLGLSIRPALTAWDALARRTVASILERGRRARFDERQLAFWLRVWGIGIALAPVATWVVFRSPVLVPVVAYLAYKAPCWILGWLVDRHRRRFRNQLTNVFFTLAGATRAGMSLEQALELAAAEVANPARREFHDIAFQIRGGLPLLDVLNRAADRIDLDAYRALCMALTSALKHGGNVANTLDGLAATVVEQQRLERRMETLSADGRLTLTLLAVFPAIFFAMNYLVDPVVAMNYPGTVLGQVVIAAVVGLTYISLRVGSKYVRLDHMV